MKKFHTIKKFECDHQDSLYTSQQFEQNCTTQVFPLSLVRQGTDQSIGTRSLGQQKKNAQVYAMPNPTALVVYVQPLSNALIHRQRSNSISTQQNLLTWTLINWIFSLGRSLLTSTLSRRIAWVEDVVVIARVQQGHSHSSRNNGDILSTSSIELLHSEGYRKRSAQGRHHDMVRKLSRWNDTLKAPLFVEKAMGQVRWVIVYPRMDAFEIQHEVIM